ncbi:DUF7344 domain-containing protein [Halocalculus aciditolerans]|uniref:DUF7344 domain-containing protein n=1 Tax=Halocalculus aciditolerans TaxID=1383812 RepID=A0A830FIK6_9EURY|nr:hypothetical protein [Halocalculus aciditolerans]GGL58599.1 hypothetical protein GCM10009039_16050 [Halocalculus aciditolerans]
MVVLRGILMIGNDAPAGRDEVFGLLSNRRRRYALHACKRYETPIELGDLAEHVAAWEYEKEREQLDAAERKRVYTSLQQSHLPKMANAGMIEFENHEITLTERADDLDVYLDVVPGNSIPWAEYYLGVGAVSLALLSTVAIDIYPGFIPDLAWGGLVAVVFTLSAAYHVWRSRSMRIGAADEPPEVGE